MGDMADLVDMMMDQDDDQPSEGRCMFCGTKILWEFDGDRWTPINKRNNIRHECKQMRPGPEQDFEVLP